MARPSAHASAPAPVPGAPLGASDWPSGACVFPAEQHCETRSAYDRHSRLIGQNRQRRSPEAPTPSLTGTVILSFMPKRESPSSRTTLYRLKRVPKLIDAIRAKYLDSGSFEATKTAGSGRKALLVHGAMSSDQASWASRLSDLSGIEVRVGNETAAGVLLIRDGKKRAFALSYGMGFQLLDQNKIDQGFGLRIAVRTAALRT